MLIGSAGIQVEFAEQIGEQRRSPSFRFAPEAAQSQRSLYLPYSPEIKKVWDASMALLGYSKMAGDNLGVAGAARRWIERVLPASIPAFKTEVNPGLTPYLYCTSIPLVEPIGRSKTALTDGLTDYDWWRFATVWETPSYDIKSDLSVLAQGGPLRGAPGAGTGDPEPDEGDALRRGRTNTRWITRSMDPGSHAQSLRAFGKFCEMEGQDAQNIPEGYTTTVARIVVTYVHHYIPGYAAFPFDTVTKALGTVNDDTFDGFPIGTLMLSDCKLREYRDSFGQRVLDAAYTCIYRPLIDPVTQVNWGWQGILRVVNGKLRVWPISADGLIATTNVPAGRALRAYSDFASLFRPPQG